MPSKSPRIIGEWLFTITTPTKGRRGRVGVMVENVDAEDRDFARAVAILIECWMNAAPTARR